MSGSSGREQTGCFRANAVDVKTTVQPCSCVSTSTLVSSPSRTAAKQSKLSFRWPHDARRDPVVVPHLGRSSFWRRSLTPCVSGLRQERNVSEDLSGPRATFCRALNAEGWPIVSLSVKALRNGSRRQYVRSCLLPYRLAQRRSRTSSNPSIDHYSLSALRNCVINGRKRLVINGDSQLGRLQ